MNNAFVYKWHDTKRNMFYIGYHKGDPDDGYVCSSKSMLAEYRKRPFDFVRTILLQGSLGDIQKAEAEMLLEVDAAHNPAYYNLHNASGEFVCTGHTKESRLKISAAARNISDETRAKMSAAKKGKPLSGKRKENARAALAKGRETLKSKPNGFAGKHHTDETKMKIRNSRLGKKRQPICEV